MYFNYRAGWPGYGWTGGHDLLAYPFSHSQYLSFDIPLEALYIGIETISVT
jgi:hypothetical protein